MSVLITGATGFIGVNLAETLLACRDRLEPFEKIARRGWTLTLQHLLSTRIVKLSYTSHCPNL